MQDAMFLVPGRGLTGVSGNEAFGIASKETVHFGVMLACRECSHMTTAQHDSCLLVSTWSEDRR